MAETKGVRLKVPANAGVLVEDIKGEKDPGSGKHASHTVRIKPGETFIHPDRARAEQLLGITPAVVVRSTDLTTAELKRKEIEEKAVVGLVSDQLHEQARKIVAERTKKLADLDEKLRKMKPEDVMAEAKKRGLTFDGQTPGAEEVVAAILEDEKEELEKTTRVQG